MGLGVQSHLRVGWERVLGARGRTTLSAGLLVRPAPGASLPELASDRSGLQLGVAHALNERLQVDASVDVTVVRSRGRGLVLLPILTLGTRSTSTPHHLNVNRTPLHFICFVRTRTLEHIIHIYVCIPMCMCM